MRRGQRGCRKNPWARYPQGGGLNGTPIDVVFGGAPCQGFSLIGKWALDDPRNRLLAEFVRLTTELDARYFVFENVKGLTIGQHRKLLDEVIEAFQKKGYKVLLPYRVLNAADFGVPQDRRRLFLIGAQKLASQKEVEMFARNLVITVISVVSGLWLLDKGWEYIYQERRVVGALLICVSSAIIVAGCALWIMLAFQ